MSCLQSVAKALPAAFPLALALGWVRRSASSSCSSLNFFVWSFRPCGCTRPFSTNCTIPFSLWDSLQCWAAATKVCCSVASLATQVTQQNRIWIMSQTAHGTMQRMPVRVHTASLAVPITLRDFLQRWPTTTQMCCNSAAWPHHVTHQQLCSRSAFITFRT